MRFMLILMLVFLTGCEAQARPRRPRPKPITPDKLKPINPDLERQINDPLKPMPPQPKRPTPPPKVEPAPKKDTVEVLDFYTDWCGWCKKNAPAIDRIEREGTKVTRIDGDREPKLTAQWQVVSYPTYIVLVNGKESFRTRDPAVLRARLQNKKLPRL